MTKKIFLAAVLTAFMGLGQAYADPCICGDIDYNPAVCAGGGGVPDPCGSTVPSPVDGGIGFLIAAGVAFGVRRVSSSRRRKKD